MQIKLISKYRKELMGIAILFIMFCHSTLVFENELIKAGYNALRWFCRIGVDMFFMLSGMGLYFSMKRNQSVRDYYKRRFSRLFLPCIIVAVCWAIISIGMSWENVGPFIQKYSLITFYTKGELAAWFIAAIIVLYLIYPLLFRLTEINPKALYILIAIIWICSVFISIIDTSQVLQTLNNIFVVRIPSFIFGTIVALWINNGKTIELKNLLLALIAALVVLIVNYELNDINIRCIERIVFLPTAFSISAILSNMLNQSNSKPNLGIFNILGGGNTGTVPHSRKGSVFV